MFGAWNEALASKNGLLQARTLDWDMSGPFRDHPHITGSGNILNFSP
jgi:hypothetical protein